MILVLEVNLNLTCKILVILYRENTKIRILFAIILLPAKEVRVIFHHSKFLSCKHIIESSWKNSSERCKIAEKTCISHAKVHKMRASSTIHSCHATHSTHLTTRMSFEYLLVFTLWFFPIKLVNLKWRYFVGLEVSSEPRVAGEHYKSESTGEVMNTTVRTT